VIDERDGHLRGVGLGGALIATLTQLLSRTLGPLLRLRKGDDSTFLNHLSQTHSDAMDALSDDHWERLIRAVGLVGVHAILDVGCGSGGWLTPLARLNTRIVGIDVDDALLDVARPNSSSADNVEIWSMSAESLRFADESFDAVACFTLLPYLDQPVALGEMARVLRPNGRLVLGTVGFGYYAKHIAEGIRHEDLDAIRYGLDPILVAAGRALAGNKIAPDSLRCWSPRAVRRLLESQGFAVDRVVRDVGAVDPSWPRTFLGRPVYFITFAEKRGAARSRPFVRRDAQRSRRTDMPW
jgi:SAM-dependent methyltransferase